MTFVPNKNFAREMAGESSYQEGLARAAQPAADAAKSFAPVRSGAYRDGIAVVIAGRKVYLSAKDFKSIWLEYGTEDTPVFAPLRRAVRAAGLDLRESSK